MAAVCLRHHHLTLELGAAVDTSRPGRIILAVLAILGAIENIIGRKMDDRAIVLGRDCGQRTGTVAVHRIGRGRVALGIVHGCIGRCINDEIGSQVAHRGRKCCRVQ